MTKLTIILFFLFLLLQQCQVPSVKLIGKIDPDIVLINIENGDRAFLGKLLLKIDSLNPKLIGIDVLFEERKDRRQDSILINAFKKISNDILVYNIKENGEYSHSDPSFTSVVSDEGFLNYEKTLGLISNMTPLPTINNEIRESFVLKIVNRWKPDFHPNIQVNQNIPINYTRMLEQYICVDGSFLLKTNINDFDLPDKIILVGYTGPGQEDKHFTPLRLVNEEYKDNEPDTYGLVIIANEIRTILGYKK